MRISPQPIQPLKSGDVIRESHFRENAAGINIANEMRTPPNVTNIRWAITTPHETNGYPAWSDNPFAYPFRWLNLNVKSTAPADIKKPTRKATDLSEWERKDGKHDAVTGINGYAVNLNEMIFPEIETAIDYVPEGMVVLVAWSGLNNFWIVRDEPPLVFFRTTGEIDRASNAGVYNSAMCDLFTFEDVTESTHSRTAILDDEDNPIQRRVINPSLTQSIPANVYLWALRTFSGHHLATVWPC